MYYVKESTGCKVQGPSLSLHLKANMMKVSVAVISGYTVEVFFKDLEAGHDEMLT